MSTATNLQEIKNIVIACPNGEILFQSPIHVKKTPHHHLFSCYGVTAHESKGVWLLDGKGEWYRLEETDQHADYVVNSVLQRLKLIGNVVVAKYDQSVNDIIF